MCTADEEDDYYRDLIAIMEHSPLTEASPSGFKFRRKGMS